MTFLTMINPTIIASSKSELDEISDEELQGMNINMSKQIKDDTNSGMNEKESQSAKCKKENKTRSKSIMY